MAKSSLANSFYVGATSILIPFLILMTVLVSLSGYFVRKEANSRLISTSLESLQPVLLNLAIHSDFRTLWSTIASTNLFEDESLILCDMERRPLAFAPTVGPKKALDLCSANTHWAFTLKTDLGGEILRIKGGPRSDFTGAVYQGALFFLITLSLFAIATPFFLRKLRLLFQKKMVEFGNDLRRALAQLTTSQLNYSEFEGFEMALGKTIEELKNLQNAEVELKAQINRIGIERSVAHDLASPLMALKSVSDKIQTSDADAARLLSLVIQRLEDLLRSLQKGKIGQQSSADLGQVLEGAIRLFRTAPKLADDRIRFRCDIKGTAACDPDYASRLARMINNLLSNSIDAIGEDAEGAIEMTATVSSREVEILVCDSGRGMSPEELSLALRGGWTSKNDGHGIGLSASYAWVTSSNGEFQIVSTPGQGTKISIRMPVLLGANG